MRPLSYISFVYFIFCDTWDSFPHIEVKILMYLIIFKSQNPFTVSLLLFFLLAMPVSIRTTCLCSLSLGTRLSGWAEFAGAEVWCLFFHSRHWRLSTRLWLQVCTTITPSTRDSVWFFLLEVAGAEAVEGSLQKKLISKHTDLKPSLPLPYCNSASGSFSITSFLIVCVQLLQYRWVALT